MNRYKKLMGNTLLFGVASFSTKMLNFLLLPIVTRLMVAEDISTQTLVTDTCNLIIPIISLSIHESVIRFGMEESERKSDVFTSAITTILIGYGILWLCYPLLGLITRISDFRFYIYLYVLTSALRQTTTHFVRASGFSRIFALDGLITTATTIGLVLLFVAKLEMGVAGYILGTIVADAISAVGQILLLRLYRFYKPRRFSRDTLRRMILYSAPLVPTALFWWITNLSDRYLVDWLVSPQANGIYAISYKLPSLLTMISAFFIQAWQMSAFSEEDKREQARFYSGVFASYSAFVSLVAAGLILLIRPLTSLLYHARFYESWRYVPFLMLAVACSCLVTFLGTIYNVVKQNRMITVTTFIGAVVNIGMNLILIPKYGPNGAAFATFISYFVVFVIRAIDTRRYLKINIQPLRLVAVLCLLLLQVWVCLSQVRFGILMQIGLILLLLLCNLGPVLFMTRSLLRQLVRRPSR